MAETNPERISVRDMDSAIFRQNEDNTETLILYIDGFINIKHRDNDILHVLYLKVQTISH